jgi:suppressor of ftsI/bilirubin oxidase
LLPTPIRCEQVFLATAERIDLLIDLRDTNVGDVLRMETLVFDPMYAKAAEVAASDHAGMGATGGPKAGSPHEYLHRWPEGSPRTLLELRVRKRVAYDRAIPARLSDVPAIDVAAANERPFRLGFAKGRWRINDRVFEMGAAPIEVQRNTVETWLIRNYHTSMPHAMHLHGFHFEVLARETSPDEIAALQQDPQGRLATDFGRKDTVLVWPGESVRIAIDFTLPFPGPQSYLFHCHNLEHEDGGMMLPVLVV